MASKEQLSLVQEIASTHPHDRALMAAYGIAGLLSLIGAFALAAVLVVIKTPAFGPPRGDLYYRMLTAHAILGFIYWFAFIQAALLIAGATALRNGGRLWSLKLGWTSFALMATGLVVIMLGVFRWAYVVYSANQQLAESFAAAPFAPYRSYTRSCSPPSSSTCRRCSGRSAG